MRKAQYGLRNQCEQVPGDAILGGSTGLPSSEGKRRRECTGRRKDLGRYPAIRRARFCIKERAAPRFSGQRAGEEHIHKGAKSFRPGSNPRVSTSPFYLWLFGDGDGVFNWVMPRGVFFGSWLSHLMGCSSCTVRCVNLRRQLACGLGSYRKTPHYTHCLIQCVWYQLFKTCTISSNLKISEGWNFELNDIKFMNTLPIYYTYEIVDACFKVFVSEFKEVLSSSFQSTLLNFEASPNTRILKRVCIESFFLSPRHFGLREPYIFWWHQFHAVKNLSITFQVFPHMLLAHPHYMR